MYLLLINLENHRIFRFNDKGRLSSEEIERMVQEAEKYKEQDEQVKLRIEAKNELENRMYSIKGSLLMKPVKEKLSSEEIEQLETVRLNTEEWLDSHQSEEAEVYQGKTKALQEIVSPILSKLHRLLVVVCQSRRYAMECQVV